MTIIMRVTVPQTAVDELKEHEGLKTDAEAVEYVRKGFAALFEAEPMYPGATATVEVIP